MEWSCHQPFCQGSSARRSSPQCGLQGADFADLQAYVGQTPKSVMAIHYDHVGAERFEKIADLAQGLSEGSPPIERTIDADEG